MYREDLRSRDGRSYFKKGKHLDVSMYDLRISTPYRYDCTLQLSFGHPGFTHLVIHILLPGLAFQATTSRSQSC